MSYPEEPLVEPSSVGPATRRPYVYLLSFSGVPDGFKVGITEVLRMRVDKHSTDPRGPLLPCRGTVVTTRDRAEAVRLEGHILELYQDYKYELPAELACGDGDTEWLRADAYEMVRATMQDWMTKRPGRSQFVSFAQALAEGRRDAGFLNREEREERRRSKAAAQEAARQQRNAANFEGCCRTIEEHHPYLTRVTLVTSLGRVDQILQAQLFFRLLGKEDKAQINFDPAHFAQRLNKFAYLNIWPHSRGSAGMWMIEGHPCETTYWRPPKTPMHEMVIVSRMQLYRIDEDVRRDTPQVEAWLHWLVGLRERVARATKSNIVELPSAV